MERLQVCKVPGHKVRKICGTCITISTYNSYSMVLHCRSRRGENILGLVRRGSMSRTGKMLALKSDSWYSWMCYRHHDTFPRKLPILAQPLIPCMFDTGNQAIVLIEANDNGEVPL